LVAVAAQEVAGHGACYRFAPFILNANWFLRACCIERASWQRGLASRVVLTAMWRIGPVTRGRCLMGGVGQLLVTVVARQSLSRLWVPHGSFHSA
jgi:hypothetical protein